MCEGVSGASRRWSLLTVQGDAKTRQPVSGQMSKATDGLS